MEIFSLRKNAHHYYCGVLRVPSSLLTITVIDGRISVGLE
jgi:hypothetical protein